MPQRVLDRKRVVTFGALLLVLAAVVVWRLQLRSPLVTPVRSEEEWLRLESVRLLRDYVRLPTENPPGREGLALGFFKAIFDREGIPYEIFEGVAGRGNLVAKLGPPRESLILHHHMDVSPAGDLADWPIPPYSGAIDGMYLFGRGSLDDKSLGILELMAFLELKRQAVRLTREVVYVAVSDEETGGGWGTEWLLEHHPELIARAAGVITEGGVSEAIIDRVSYWGIEVGQIQLVRLEVSGDSRSRLDDVITALKRQAAANDEWRTYPEVERFFAEIAAVRKFDQVGYLKKKMSNLRGSVADAQFRQKLPPPLRALLSVRIATKERPDRDGRAVSEVVFALPPDSDTKAYLEPLMPVLLVPGIESKILQWQDRAPCSPTDTELFRVLCETAKNVYGNLPCGTYLLPGTSTDAKFFRRRGIPAYGVQPFPINFFEASRMDGAQERVELERYVQGEVYMKRCVREFATALLPAKN